MAAKQPAALSTGLINPDRVAEAGFNLVRPPGSFAGAAILRAGSAFVSAFLQAVALYMSLPR